MQKQLHWVGHVIRVSEDDRLPTPRKILHDNFEMVLACRVPAGGHRKQFEDRHHTVLQQGGIPCESLPPPK